MMIKTLLISLFIGVSVASNLKANFGLVSSEHKRLEAIVTLKNEHAGDVYVLPWDTPADYLNGGQFFQLFCDGEQLEYQGIFARRVPATFADYHQIHGHSTASFSVDLSDGFDTSKPCAYTVVMNDFSTTLIVKSVSETDDAVVSEVVEGSAISIELNTEGTWRDARLLQIEEPHGLGHTYSGCTAAQQTSINSAFTAYAGLMVRSVNAMRTAATSQIYRDWFGTYTDARYATVNTCINRLKTTSETGNYLFTCSAPQCSSGVIAYVYSNDATKMYLCATFFTIPATGPTSRADTMPHEISHYTATCGTNDAAYGQTNCKNLATSNPAAAIKNADNYAFFSVYA